MESYAPENILIVRTDRIGDVILSLPMVSALRASFPAARISILLRSYTKPLAEGYPGLDGILLSDDKGIEKPWGRILTELRREAFDTAIVVYPRFRLAALMVQAGIPRRIGTGYRWYSFLFTDRVYEHRKTAQKHEAEYNLALLEPLGCEVPKVIPLHLPVGERELNEAHRLLEGLGINMQDPIAVLHPGSGGSAREWPARHFASLAEALVRDGFEVVITGGPGEAGLAHEVASAAGQGVKALTGITNLKVLAAVLKQAAIVVGNSSGPLHIAAAVGTPVVGLFPPMLACSPVRWGPLGVRNHVFVPDKSMCPRCRGGACRGNECMELIHPHEVLQAVRRLVSSLQPKVSG